MLYGKTTAHKQIYDVYFCHVNTFFNLEWGAGAKTSPPKKFLNSFIKNKAFSRCNFGNLRGRVGIAPVPPWIRHCMICNCIRRIFIFFPRLIIEHRNQKNNSSNNFASDSSETNAKKIPNESRIKNIETLKNEVLLVCNTSVWLNGLITTGRRNRGHQRRRSQVPQMFFVYCSSYNCYKEAMPLTSQRCSFEISTLSNPKFCSKQILIEINFAFS